MEQPTNPFVELPSGALRVLQLSDTHLYADPESCLSNVNTHHSLEKLLDHVRAKLLPVDCVLATGDLAHKGEVEAYKRLQAQLSTLNAPTYCLPGNHDHIPSMELYLSSSTVSMPSTVQHGQWTFVLLNSYQEGKISGYLTQEELSRLEQELQAHSNQHVLICLHHHPMPTGSDWIDSLALDNATQFLETIDRYTNIRGVTWGHIHQDFNVMRNGVRMMGAPSTCVQFAPNRKEFELDLTQPALRWLILLPDGEIQTGITQLPSALLDTHPEPFAWT